MVDKYRFQNKIVKDIELACTGDLPVVLGGAPGLGKTFVLMKFLNRYFQKNPNSKVVLIPSNSITLQDQFMEVLKNALLKLLFSFSELSEGKDTQLTIALPKTLLRAIKKGFSYDGLIQDEAHLLSGNAFRSGGENTMMRKILTTYPLKLCLLLTGSPFMFKSQESFKTLYYSAEEVEEMSGGNVFNGVDIHIMRSSHSSLLGKLKQIFKYIKVNKLNKKKVIFYCKSQQQARAVDYYLRDHFRLRSAVSTSDTDPDGNLVKSFRTGELDVLVVRSRLREGYSDHCITMCVELGGTLNEQLAQQMLCRLNRWHSELDRKNFIRVIESSSKSTIRDHYMFLDRVRRLFTKEGFREFAT